MAEAQGGRRTTSEGLPLDGVRVVDLTHVLSGPFTTMLLGDLGAEVLKIEKPGRGDTTRGTPPYIDGTSHYFLAINRNKRSVGLDLKTGDGCGVLRDLLRRSDVLINNFRPGVMERLGFGWEQLRTLNPRLINCTVTGFGKTGSWSRAGAFDLIVQAMTGTMSVTGEQGGPPVRCGLSVGDLAAGVYAAQAISLALYHRTRTGRGSDIDVSMFDCLFSFLAYYVPLYQATGKAPGRYGSGHPSMVPGEAFPTKDGHLTIAAFNQGFWTRFCEVIGHSEWTADARFETPKARRDNREVLTGLIRDVLRRKTTAEWMHALAEADVPFGPVWTVPEAVESDLATERDLVYRVSHGRARDVRVAGYPVKFSSFEPGVRLQPPELGADTEEVLRRVLGYDEAEISRLRAAEAIA